MKDTREALQEIFNHSDSAFDRALEDLITDYKAKVIENQKWLNDSERKIREWDAGHDEAIKELGEEELEEGEWIDPPVTTMEYIETVHELNGAIHYKELWRADLLAVYEAKVIHRFKQVELCIKKYISYLRKGSARTKLYSWVEIKKSIKDLGVNIPDTKGYNEINQLRLTCNSIKHSELISDELRKQNVKEFIGLEELDYESLELFYERVRPRTKDFLFSVGQLLLERYKESHA